MRGRVGLRTVLSLSAVLIAAFVAHAAAAASLRVVATTSDLASLARVVAGDLAEVETIVPPAADSEAFEPRPSDLAKLKGAAVVVRVGLGYDHWLDKLLAMHADTAVNRIAGQMQAFLVGMHSLWRWVVLIAVLVALVRGLIGWLRGGDWTGLDRQLSLLATTALDIQLLLGILLWITERRWSDGAFFAFVHPLVMIAAIAVAHLGSIRIRRETDAVARHRWLALSLLVVLILVTAAIPSYSWSRIWA